MKTNRKTVTPAPRTGGGAVASRINDVLKLRRSVLAHFLWEKNFYEDGTDVVSRIEELVPRVDPKTVADIALEARNKQKLRHVPLKIVREMVKHNSHKPFVSDALFNVIQRPDELSEFLSLYWGGKKTPLANSVKKGLARAFSKFDEYSLAKYNRDQDIKLRDVLFLCHAKPQNKTQEKLWKRLVDNTLKTPDTWEVELSGGKGENKKESWTRLLKENKLGALALLRNLRNMEEAGVDDSLVRQSLKNCNPERVLPFRFITAARYAPRFEAELEQLMFKCLEKAEKLKGKTVLVVDVSGSMGGGLSSKSELNRLDTAKALAMLIREVSEEFVIYCTAGCDGKRIHQTEMVRPRRGFALAQEIDEAKNRLGGGGIFLKQMMDFVYSKEKSAQRTITISDSQDCSIDPTDSPEKAFMFGKQNYLMDIGCEQNGIAYKKAVVINGFSEALVDYIVQYEQLPTLN